MSLFFFLDTIGVSDEKMSRILDNLMENPLIPLHDNFSTSLDLESEEDEESGDDPTDDPPSWADDQRYFPVGVTPCFEEEEEMLEDVKDILIWSPQQPSNQEEDGMRPANQEEDVTHPTGINFLFVIIYQFYGSGNGRFSNCSACLFLLFFLLI